MSSFDFERFMLSLKYETVYNTGEIRITTAENSAVT